jgi:hypothetical protein
MSTHLLFGRRRFDWVFVDCTDLDQSPPTYVDVIGSLLVADKFILIENDMNSNDENTLSLFSQLCKRSPQAVIQLD